MKLEGGQELYFGMAYWKKRWVSVPFFHLPDGAITETGELARFKFTPLDGQKIEPLPKRENRALEKNAASIKETIVPWLWSEKALKELCRQNDIPLNWVTDRFPRKARHTESEANRREERKIPSLTPKEYGRIRKEIVRLNEQVAVVVEIVWYLNQILGKGGDFVTLEEVARLQVQDVDPDVPNGSNCISLFRSGTKCHLVVHFLPPRLWRAVCQQIKDDSVFVFSTRNGGPLLPVQIDACLKRAAKMAGFKETITSASLRPPFDKKQAEKSAKKYHRDASIKPYLDPVSMEEWSAICEQIPAIVERKGRKAAHNPLELFNAMLHLLRTQCPIRKLPKEFPSWRAVESQQRRWEKRGFSTKLSRCARQRAKSNSTTTFRVFCLSIGGRVYFVFGV